MDQILVIHRAPLNASHRLVPASWQNASKRSRHYGYPIATMNQTMALAKARLTRVRTRSQPFMTYLPHHLLAYQAPAVRPGPP
jgi:hypothetical protein